MDHFVYFMLSVVWRGAVHQWPDVDGSLTVPLPLGGFEDPIRQYLLGKAPFPPHTAVIVFVCSDDDSRRRWIVPGSNVEVKCLSLKFLALGIAFRAMMGRHIPQFYLDRCCRSPRKCIFYGDLSSKTKEIIGTLEAMRDRNMG